MVMIAVVAAFMITVNFFALAEIAEIAMAFGESCKPARMSTLSRVTSSCASRVATSGATPPVSFRAESKDKSGAFSRILLHSQETWEIPQPPLGSTRESFRPRSEIDLIKCKKVERLVLSRTIVFELAGPQVAPKLLAQPKRGNGLCRARRLLARMRSAPTSAAFGGT